MAMFSRLLAGAAIGAGIMYLLDPDGGRRRRALVRDQIVSAAHKTTDAVDATSRDVANRARGVVAELRGRLRREHVGDDVLRERVRARIGSVIGHAGGIETRVSDGKVTLRGPVLSEELDRLLRRVRGVRGVADVISELDVHETPGNIPALQGRPRPSQVGEVFDLIPTRWLASSSLLGMAGAALAVAGLAVGRRQFGW
jgi:BON domain-containing protein